MKEEKLFEATWDGRYYVFSKKETHKEDFFNDNNGYEHNEIEKIHDLKVGEIYIIDVGHKIKRIK